jgi:TPR repeat protein
MRQTVAIVAGVISVIGLGCGEVGQTRARAERGDVNAQFELGERYATGRGVSQNHIEAAKWFRKAADQGMREAQYNLGFLYASGQGFPADYVEAVRWYRKAADQGLGEAQRLLGNAYFLGDGVPRDYARAHMWLSLSAGGGRSKPPKLLRVVKRKMSEEQVAEAQRLAREWLENHPKPAP